MRPCKGQSWRPLAKPANQLAREPQVDVAVLGGRFDLCALVPLVEAGDEQEGLVGADEFGRDAPIIAVELPAAAVERDALGAAQRRVVVAWHRVRDQPQAVRPGGAVSGL